MRRALLFGCLGGVAALLAGDARSPIALARLSVCGTALGGAAVIDLRDHRIPNRLVLPAAGTCAILEIVDPSNSDGIVVGLAVVCALLIASLTQPGALGMGDVKLALLVVLGVDNRGLRALALGFVLAGLAGLAILVRHGKAGALRALPLAPFFALGSLLALLA